MAFFDLFYANLCHKNKGRVEVPIQRKSVIHKNIDG